MEIIVIDDSSPDGTAQVVEGLRQKYSNLKLIVRPGKNGLGSAVMEGMKVAQSDLIAVMDGDLQHPPELLVSMLERAKDGNDIVIASRYTEGGGAGDLSPVRKLISKSATFMAHIMLRKTRSVRDPLSGYFIFNRKVLDGVEINPTGYKILLEILIKGNFSKTEEVAFTFRPRFKGTSKLSLKEDMKYVHLILKLAEYRPLKFIGVGLIGVLVNEGVLYLLYSHGMLPFILADAVSIESSILSNFTFNSVWTFRSRRESTLLLRGLKYNAVALFGFFINLFVATGLYYHSPINYLLSNLAGIILAFLANYLGSELFVWSNIGSRRAKAKR